MIALTCQQRNCISFGPPARRELADTHKEVHSHAQATSGVYWVVRRRRRANGRRSARRTAASSKTPPPGRARRTRAAAARSSAAEHVVGAEPLEALGAHPAVAQADVPGRRAGGRTRRRRTSTH